MESKPSTTEIMKVAFPLNTKDKGVPFYFKKDEKGNWILTKPEEGELYLIVGEPETETIENILFKVITLSKNEIGYPAVLLVSKNQNT